MDRMNFQATLQTPTGQRESVKLSALTRQDAAKKLRKWKGSTVKIIGLSRA
jgi:hypothetical protein